MLSSSSPRPLPCKAGARCLTLHLHPFLHSDSKLLQTHRSAENFQLGHGCSPEHLHKSCHCTKLEPVCTSHVTARLAAPFKWRASTSTGTAQTSSKVLQRSTAQQKASQHSHSMTPSKMTQCRDSSAWPRAAQGGRAHGISWHSSIVQVEDYLESVQLGLEVGAVALHLPLHQLA